MEAITLGDIDLNCPHNCKNHNTHFFGTDKQIVRRGQAFKFYVNFQNREWDNSTDTISFTVETGLRPCESNGTKCSFSLGTCIDQSCWSACYKPHQKKCMNITLFPPTNACIGRHILNMHVTSCHHTYDRCLGDFYILFNPWCADDPVYMFNQAQREEYVLNEQGMLYQGVHKHITSRPWNFGQFEDSILDICLKVLDMGANYHHDSDRESSWRNDPVQVSVVVNHMISSDGSNSIMKLPQNNDYLQGTKPQSWNGSVPILQQWYKGRCRPVRYGDSASLASVMCTVMRCLGIPSRVVTNFYSPHHAENPLVVNELFDCTGKTLRGKDSLWSYHCWNESWMSRKDLNQHCGDWQCLDPTPLETGTGSICCGPTWVRSIKDGDLDLDYDGHHIFSRLNAGCVGWLCQGSGSKTKLYYDTWPCGQYISTKSVGNDLREDITRTYKYELGSLKDKEAFYRAYRKIHSGYSDAPNSDIDGELTSLRSPFLSDAGIAMRLKMANCPVYGQDICLQWVLENLRKEPKNLNFNLCAQVITCNGYPLDQFWKDNMNVILGPREVKTIPLHIPYDQYGPHLSDYNIIRVVAISEPGCAGEVLMGNRDIAINKPPVDIKLLGQPRLHAPCSAEISFCNPLQEDLRNCVLSLEGVGLFREPATIDLGKLAANHQARTIVEFTPYREGCHMLLANLRCHKFGYCKGYANANVETAVPQVVCSSPPPVVGGSAPQVVCGSPPQVVCGSPPQPMGGSASQTTCEYVCIPVCNSGSGTGAPLIYDYVCLPVGHPMCESVYRAAATSAPYSMSDSVSRSVCDNVSRLLGVPVSFSMSDPRSAPTSHPMSAPVVQSMCGSVPAPASYPMGAPLVQVMCDSMPSPPSYAMSLQMPPAMRGSVPSPPSYAMSLQMPPAVRSSGPAPLSYSTSVSMTETVCGSMPAPVSHPTCGPVSRSVSGSVRTPMSRFASQSVSTSAARSVCSPMSHPVARSVCAPMSRPVARSVGVPTARSVCGPKWGPSCSTVSHSARGLASQSMWNSTWVPASHKARSSTLRSAYRTLPRNEPWSAYGTVSRSVPLSLGHSEAYSSYGTLSRPAPTSAYGTLSRSTYGALSRPAPRSTYDPLSPSSPRSKYNTLSRSAWALTRVR